MRYAALLMLIFVGCAGAKADDPKPPATTKLTYTEQVARFEAAVAANTATLGNTNSELESIDQRLKSVESKLDSLNKLLTVESELSIPVPPVEPPPVHVDAPPKDSDARITFQGKPINVQEWLGRRVTEVEIRGDIDAHLRDHGLDGDFSGLTRAEKIKLHSVAHSTGVPLKSSKIAVNAAVIIPQSSNCPNGNCARMQYGTVQGRARLFGRWR